MKTAGALAVLAALHAPAPAEAGGGVTMMITPNGDAADFINTGLRIYGLAQQYKGAKKKKNLATVKQKGVNNAAALSQKAPATTASHQKGSATRRQTRRTATTMRSASSSLARILISTSASMGVGQTGSPCRAVGSVSGRTKPPRPVAFARLDLTPAKA
jgi:hypothetical protein